jgi:hypothetical protein
MLQWPGIYLDALFGWCGWPSFVFEGQHQDALQRSYIDQVEAERSSTGGLQAFGRVAFG